MEGQSPVPPPNGIILLFFHLASPREDNVKCKWSYTRPDTGVSYDHERMLIVTVVAHSDRWTVSGPNFGTKRGPTCPS